MTTFVYTVYLILHTNQPLNDQIKKNLFKNTDSGAIDEKVKI